MSASIALTTNPFLKWSIKSMGSRMKKLVYLSSLAATLNNTQELDKDIAIKLNNILSLASTGTSSLKLPIYLSKLIWSNRSVLEPVFDTLKESMKDSTKECDYRCIEAILQATPDWIKYTDETSMKEDISKLFCPTHNLIRIQ